MAQWVSICPEDGRFLCLLPAYLDEILILYLFSQIDFDRQGENWWRFRGDGDQTITPGLSVINELFTGAVQVTFTTTLLLLQILLIEAPQQGRLEAKKGGR